MIKKSKYEGNINFQDMFHGIESFFLDEFFFD